MNYRNAIRATVVAGALSAAALACAPPAPPSPVALGGQARYSNTQEWLDFCAANNGTALRDPQPPRPASDPGPYFICEFPNVIL